MIPVVFSRLIILALGYLYPAFNSYKAIRDKNTREYVKWMMYWVVFALFCFAETFADIFVSFWCPFYYEIKILTVIWFLAPATRGSSYLYRNFVHPFFSERAAEIDGYLGRIHRQGIVLLVSLGSRLFTNLSASLFDALVKFAPHMAAVTAGAGSGAGRGGQRSILTASTTAVTATRRVVRDGAAEGHGDEGDTARTVVVDRVTTARQFISELSDGEEGQDDRDTFNMASSSGAAGTPGKRVAARRRQPQLRAKRAVVQAAVLRADDEEEDMDMGRDMNLISDDEDEIPRDESHMDEDMVELMRSNSFEREFFPREMLASHNDEDDEVSDKKVTKRRGRGGSTAATSTTTRGRGRGKGGAKPRR